MAILTSQQINELYEKYSNIDVTFTKEINDFLRLERNQIFLKFKDEQRPCIIYSSSMVEAKIIVALSLEKIKSLKDDNLATLRFSFFKEKRTDILSFYVQARIEGLTQYDKERNLYCARLKFTRKPPDDLIEILGNLLEANINAARRKDERITINKNSLQRLGITSQGAVVLIERVPRKALIHDISFGGIELIVLGNPKFLQDKYVVIKISLASGQSIILKGKIVRVENVPGQKGIVSLGIKLDEDSVGYEYKTMINDYLRYARKAPGLKNNI